MWFADEVSEEELTTLALAADPSIPLARDAQPWRPDQWSSELLPSWYMPAPQASLRGTGTRVVVGVVVAGLLIIGAFGLCITCGFLSLA